MDRAPRFRAHQSMRRCALRLAWTAAVVFAAAPAASGQVAKVIFDVPATIQSFKVDAAVLDIPGAQVATKGGDDFHLSTAVRGGVVTGGEVGVIGKTASSAMSFGYLAAAAGFGSADVWSEFSVVTPPIPEQVGDEEVDAVEIRITGRLREANLDTTVCGAAWTAELVGVHIQSAGPPEARYEFPSIGCVLPEGAIFDLVDAVSNAADVIGGIQGAFDYANVVLENWQDFEVRISLYDRYVPRDQPLHLAVQLGRRVGAALAAGGVSGGEIQVNDIRVVGWANIGPIVYLRTWHSYAQDSLTVQRLVDVTAYDIKLAQAHSQPYPAVSIACPPYPLFVPTQRIRGRIYAIEGNHYWRLEYLERDGDPATRVPVPGDTCSFGPIIMDRSRRLVLGFQQGVADLVITGFRTVPAHPRKGQRFELHILVQNVGDLSTLQADRRPPLSGEFKLQIKAGGTQITLPEARVFEPGASSELFGMSWTCSGSVEATVDADNAIDEGFHGEQNNTAVLPIPACAAATASPTPSCSATAASTWSPLPTATPTLTPQPARTTTLTPAATFTLPSSPSATPAATQTSTPTPRVTFTPTVVPVTESPTAGPTAQRGDVNCDGLVSAADLTALAAQLSTGVPGPCGSADINHDGRVTGEDVHPLIHTLFQ